jgi:transketolase
VTIQRELRSTADLEDIARVGRWLVVRTVATSGAGHVGGPMSAMDLWVALFFRVLDIRPDEPGWEDRDRFILSKGHAAVGLYAVMALRGYFGVDELVTFDQGDSRLQGHPDATRLPGLDASTGSLGQGLAVGIGMALAARMRGQRFGTYVMLGDGECQEGMIWESVQVAARYRLDALTVIVDQNGLQQYGWPAGERDADRGDRSDPWPDGRLGAAFEAFGWRVLDVDGHDIEAIVAACAVARDGRSNGRPTVIIARTTKGKGLSFTEGQHAWHARIPTPEELEMARVELRIQPGAGW